MNKIKIKNIITGNRYYVYEHKINKEKHIPYIPKPIKLLPNDLTLTCTQCGSTQTYCNKYSYRRAMGVGSDQTQKNKGLCGKCSRSNKREPHGPRSKKQLKHMRLVQIKQLGYNTIEEYEKDSMSKKKYYEKVDILSRTNLKRENPELYELWNENKWNGKDMNQLTIEHIKPKSICYELGIPIEEASDMSNLDVITMKENIKRWENYYDRRRIR